MKKYLVITIFFLSFTPKVLKAQFDTQLSNYWAMMNYFNPASAGYSGKLEVGGLYRLQWLGVENAPKSGLIVGDMPLKLGKKSHGVGINMYNDQIGFFKTTVFSGQFSYKMKLFSGDLGIGVQAGYIDESFDGSNVKLPDNMEEEGSEGGNAGSSNQDEAFPGQATSSSFDAAFGFFYYKPKWYVGLSVTHLTAPKLELTENVLMEVPRSYYFTAGYNIQLNNPLIELRPSFLVKATEVSSFYLEGDTALVPTKGNTLKGIWSQTQIDISLRMIYNKSLWGGISWRKDDAVVVMLGGRFKMFEVGYAYDFPLSSIRTSTTGSHELFIKYALDMDIKKGKKGRYKSVRIL